MMRRRTSKRVAFLLLLVLGIVGALGYDYFFDQNLPPTPFYHTLDWKG